MKILYLINYAGKAGTEKYVRELVDAYHGKRAQCYFAYSEDGPLREQMEERGVPIFNVKMRNAFDLSAARKLAAYCKKEGIDIIHAQYPRENYVALLSRLFYKTKVFYTCHLTYKTPFIWHIMNRVMTRHNQKIISVCNDGKDIMISNGVPKNKIKVIFNGMKYPPAPIKHEKNDVFKIVTLARYHVAKGLPFLCNVMEKLKTMTDKKFECLILGDGELWDEIGKLIEEKGLTDTVIRMGFRTDTEKILESADLYINTAKCYEALSFAILEGMAKGLPVVATAIGGNGDIINDETDCGFLVPFEDVDGFASAILKIMDDEQLSKRFSDNAITAIRTRFNLDNILDEIFNTYEER